MTIILLPYPDFEQSAKSFHSTDRLVQISRVIQTLDNLHQINETIIARLNKKAWEGHEPQLCEYGLKLCEVAFPARYTEIYSIHNIEQHLDWATSGAFSLCKPEWFGDNELHLSHQSFLVRKNERYYRQVFPDVSPDLKLIRPGE